MEILIVHFNTQELTSALVKSIRKFSPNFKVTIYDNSCNYNGPADFIIRNQIDYEELLARYPNKLPTSNNWGSVQHCYAVDHCFRHFPNGFILMDSDILLKKDITPFWQPDKIWTGQTELHLTKPGGVSRLMPYICYINVPMCREHRIKYFDDQWMWKLNVNPDNPISNNYDTGASFLKDTADLSHEIMPIYDYIVHYCSGSHRKEVREEVRPESDKYITPQQWLEKYKDLWTPSSLS